MCAISHILFLKKHLLTHIQWGVAVLQVGIGCPPDYYPAAIDLWFNDYAEFQNVSHKPSPCCTECDPSVLAEQQQEGGAVACMFLLPQTLTFFPEIVNSFFFNRS